MEQEKWGPCWVRGSKIEEIAWIGSNILAWTAGLHIVFFNISRKTQTIRRCWKQATGEGARCLSGHSTLPIFAFSEKSANPRILILAYPSMAKIAECPRGPLNGYLATAFTAHDHIVSIGVYPNFLMTISSWRTGEKVIAVNTSIRDEVGQILRITQTGPTIIAQMGRTCGKLVTWELNIVSKIVTVEDHEIKLPKSAPVYWVDWCPTSHEPLLAITDIDGHIFLSDYNGTNLQRIVLSQRCGVCVDIELPIVAWFRDGIILRTTFCQIRFFRKNPKTENWQKEWYLKSITKPCILATHPFKHDYFFYHTLEGYLMQISFPEDQKVHTIQKHLNYGAVYRFADFVSPNCHHIAATDDLRELVVLECYSGLEVSRLDLELKGDVSCQASHPDYPMIVLVSLRGESVIVGVANPLQPKILAYLRLQRGPLDIIKFSHSGRHFIAGEKETGSCYCINLFHDDGCTIQAQIQCQRPIADVLIYEGRGSLKVLALHVSRNQRASGSQLHLYDVPEGRNLIQQISGSLDLLEAYRAIWHLPGNPQFIIGSPYSTRQLRVNKLNEFRDIVVVDALGTGHQVRGANVFVDSCWITTAAFDGFVYVRDKNVKKILACFMGHHRNDFGTDKAMVSRSGDTVVCLGRDGSLIAMKNYGDRKDTPASPNTTENQSLFRVDYSLYEKQKKKIQSEHESFEPLLQSIAPRPGKAIPVFMERRDSSKTWTEWRQEVQVEEEAKMFAEERAAILQDFEALKEKIRQLIDANETCPELEMLPLSSFDLDKAARDQRLKAAKDERVDTRQRMEHEIDEMNRVSKWIKTTFWEPQKVLGKSIFSIFGDKEVANYPLVAEQKAEKDRLEWSQFVVETLRKIMENDSFQPWKKYTEEELEIVLNKRTKLHHEDDKRRRDMLLEFEEDEVEVERGVREEENVDGMTTYRFVEQSPYYYSQMETYGFCQVTLNNRFLVHDSNKLRVYFNKIFNDTYALKEREMSLIKERIERIRHIDSELNLMFGQNVPRVPDDPTWHWKEKPESIVRVLDEEVKAKPYVSESQQEILRKQAAEAERIRQLLLADDFRERALMTMMDGVLEVRWEDVIKIDVPKPRCMREKKPEDYNTDDILLVKQYEKDVQFLDEERERYKRILEADYVKVMTLMQEGIDRFNSKLNDLFQLKIKIEAAINQLNLRYIRGCVRNFQRVTFLEKEENFKEEISEKRKYLEFLEEQVQLFRNVQPELINYYEGLCNRERTMAKRFKSEFSAVSKINQEILDRQYKRRPRTSLKNIGTNNLLDLASSMSSPNKPIYSPIECLEYLKIMDNLDSRPTNLPPSIETSVWEQLTRLRRQKIDLELRIRARQVEIVDLKFVIERFNSKMNRCKTDIQSMTKTLENMRWERIIWEQDAEVQLVLKMGQVEIELRGDVNDTGDAIFIPKSEIDGINQLIRAAGNQKMDMLTRMLNFQRGTLLKQWEHGCLKMRLNNLKEDLHFTQRATVTKEMQQYLKRKARGWKDDKTQEHLEEQINAMKIQCEKIVAKYRGKLERIEEEIKVIRRKNDCLDRRIIGTNVARCEMELKRDLIAEEKDRKHVERKMQLLRRRCELIKKLQDNYTEILALQTERDLLRLRRYPMLEFKTPTDDEL